MVKMVKSRGFLVPLCIGLVLLLVFAFPVEAATTEVHVVKYAPDGVTILTETTVSYAWLEANLPVLGDGVTHYYHQGPIFEDEWESTYGLSFTGDWGASEEKWDRVWNSTAGGYEQREECNCYPGKDYGACKGTNLRDLCNLVGGMSPGDTVKIKATDGFSKTFPYENVYEYTPRQGPMVITWYTKFDGAGQYVPAYSDGMRLVFFADTSTNPWGKHIFGIGDMAACVPEAYWHYYVNWPFFYPASTGFTVKYVSDIIIYSTPPPKTWYVDDSGNANFTTIQAAVDAAAAGDTIIVRDGTYTENVLVNKSLTIRSENGTDSTTVARPSGPLADHRFAVSADYVNISGFTLKGGITDCGKAGVGLIGVAHCNITDNVAMNDSYGIRLLAASNNNSITNNVLRENYKGIELSGSSNDNLIAENNASSNADYGIWLENAHRNIVTHNTVSGAEGGGNIFLQGSNENVITYNTVSLANAESGGWVGIFIQSGADNRIYLNDFMDNDFNAATAYINGNIWNSTEPVAYVYNGSIHTGYLGNYWDDYAGNDTDGNGIGDIPYSIYKKTTDYDYHPLMASVENYLESTLVSITVSPALAVLYVNETQQFSATGYDKDGGKLDNVRCSWSSSNETVGIIDSNGLFEALAPGSTTITATNGSVTGTTTATVLPVPLALWGPYVTKTTTTATTLNWKTENLTAGTIQYAPDGYYQDHGEYEHTVEEADVTLLHHLALTNLTPNTRYHYQLLIGNRSTADRTFRTFPANGSFTFIVYTDSQEPQGNPAVTQLNRHKLVADRIAGEENVTFVLHVGDLVNDGGDLAEWNRFFEAARAMMATTTFYPTLGNHEYTNFSGSGEAVQNYYDAFELPEWYSFDCGDAHVTVLDSNTDEANMTAQTAWLQTDLTTSATWKFAALHHPPYSSTSKHYGGWTNLRELWCPLFINHSVNEVFSGHVHTYERLRADGITYVVAGLGGGPPYTLSETKLPESRSSLEYTLGYVRVTVDAENGTVKMAFIPVADCSSGDPVLYEPGAVFETVIIGSTPRALDTGTAANPYPSIPGTYRGTITVSPEHDISASRLYTYSCPGTGGHTEFVRIEKDMWNVTATWDGYSGDWRTLSFDAPFILRAEETYNYTLITGSYPQIIHARNHTTLDGSLITCMEFVDSNNRRYTDWIPAMRLEQ